MSASTWDEAVPAAASPAVVQSQRWNLATRVAFRFAFCYLILYNFPSPFVWLPFAQTQVQWYFDTWERIVHAISGALFGLTHPSSPLTDGTAGYLGVLSFAVISAAVTVVWSILDRRRANYARLYEWLRVYVRFALGFTMMSYGMQKVIGMQTQFPPPTLDRLLQPIGDSSPMGLLWTFMGASRAYTFFAGAAELLAGLLLTVRRTMLLGALMTTAVMVNVVALNFSYDVSVKLFSSHLLAMAVFLLLPDLRRLIDFFIAHRPPQLFQPRWLRNGAIALRAVLVLFILYTMFKDIPLENPRSPFYGIWTVDTLVVNGAAPAPGDPSRWRRVVFDNPRFFAVQTMDDNRTRYRLKLDEAKKSMALRDVDLPSAKAALVYQRPHPNSMLLDGTFEGRRIHAVLHKAAVPPFRLTTRGFHWITERSFFR